MTTRRKFDRLVIHVGPPKTGTSALQRLLRDARGALAEHGLVSPDWSVFPENVEVPLAFVADQSHPIASRLWANRRIRDRSEQLMVADRYRAAFLGDLSSPPGAGMTYLVSSEHLPSLLDAEGISRLLEVVTPLVGEVHLLAVARCYEDLATAAVSTLVRWNYATDLPDLNGMIKDAIAYGELVALWEGHLGIDRCHVLPYEDPLSRDVVALSGILEFLGCPASLALGAGVHNQSLSPRQLGLLCYCNATLAALPDDDSRRALRDRILLAILGTVAHDGRPVLSRDSALALRRAREADIRWLDQTFGLVFPPVPAGPQFDHISEPVATQDVSDVLLAAFRPARVPQGAR